METETLDVIVSERRQLINVAYRLLGSLADAEDVVQESCARWYALPPDRRAAVESVGAWLTTVGVRICLDQLRSARARRERYVGEWIPEPLPDGSEWSGGRPTTDPADLVTLDESVGMAFLVILDSMTPAERVPFVLHDVFGYRFAEIAGIVGRSESACRRSAASARRRIDPSAARVPPTPGQAGIVADFKRAWENHDLRSLIGLLDPDAAAIADGGGLVRAARHPVVGAARIARYLLGATAGTRQTLWERTVNGGPGLVSRQNGGIVTVTAFGFAGDRIARIWSVRNPEKLRSWTAFDQVDAPTR